MNVTPERRWMLSTDGGVNYFMEVHPLGTSKDTIAFEQGDDATGQIFKRKKAAQKFIFGGSGLNSEFVFFWNRMRQPAQRCQDIYIREEHRCRGAYNVFWTGKFSVASGDWDHDQCQFTVKPKTVDKYTCFLEQWEKKHNVLEVGPTEVSGVLELEFEFCPYLDINFDGFPNSYQCCDTDPADGWDLGNNQAYPGGGALRMYWRQVAHTECVDGAPVPPIGAGWIMVEDNCAINGTAKYARVPVIAWPYGDAVEGTCITGTSSGSIAVPPSSPECPVWHEVNGCGLCRRTSGTTGPENYAIGPWFLCLSAASYVTYERARNLMDVTNFLIGKTGCTDVLSVRSDFFEWNATGDTPGFIAGINYITGNVNEVDHLFILQKSDAIDPNASNPATRGEWSLKQLLAVLRTMFNVFWDIDDDGYLRLEHYHYWTFPVVLDTSDYATVEPMAFSSMNERVPKYERFKMLEAFNTDFVGKDIIYSGACVTTEEKNEVIEVTAEITTDLPFVFSSPDSISDSGFVMVACRLDNDAYAIINKVGAISGLLRTNATLSWANLHRDFFTWNRYLLEGNMNGQDVTFDGALPSIKQDKVIVPMCCDIINWNANGRVLTRLSSLFLPDPVPALVEKGEYDGSTGRLTLTLQYPI